MGIDNTESFFTSSPDTTIHRVPRAHYDAPDVHDALNVANDYDNVRQISPDQSTLNTSSSSGASAFTKEANSTMSNPHGAIRKDFPVDSLDHSTPVKTRPNRTIATGVPRYNSNPGTPISNFESKKYSNAVWRFNSSSTRVSNSHQSNNQPSGNQPASNRDQKSNNETYLLLRLDTLSPANLDLESSTIQLYEGAVDAETASPATSPPSSRGADSNVPLQLNFQDNSPEASGHDWRNSGSSDSNSNNFSLDTKQTNSVLDGQESQTPIDVIKTNERNIIQQQERKLQDQEERIQALEKKLANLTIEKENNKLVDSRLAQFESHPRIEKISVTAVTENTLPVDFKKYYRSLGLDKVDELSELQCKNIIKNIMLSLLVTDFEHLPQKMQQLGLYIEHTANFIDDVHQALYGSMDLNPLDYLLKVNQDVNQGFEECLAGMTSLLLQHVHNSKKSGF